jgi:1-deoxy-D-xylulose-5-phosphate reductoisomerase
VEVSPKSEAPCATFAAQTHMKAISILGSTGSIGTNTLAVVRAFPDRFRVLGLAAGSDAQGLAAQIAAFRPKVVSVATREALEALGGVVDLSGIRAGFGESAMSAVASEPGVDLVVSAAVGAAGLVPTLAAIQSGKDVALANKETLVMAGEIMTREQIARGTRLIPIDSEHCALHQCLTGRDLASVKKLWLTASGGPFRRRPAESFAGITVEEALNHPTWRMGRKISIDSATLMNKALEIIEARWLFGVGGDRIDVTVHPESVVHSLVEFNDGTWLAQLGKTDMRIPIQYALSFPEVWTTALDPMDLSRAFQLSFEPPDHVRFRSLGLAHRALEKGGTAPAVMNAANEVAVQAFLDGAIPFPAITEIVADVLSNHAATGAADLSDVLTADREARIEARKACDAGKAGSRHV